MPTKILRNNTIKNDDWMKTLPGYKDEVALHDALSGQLKEGGPGSGNFGHSGVPGQQGGSTPGGQSIPPHAPETRESVLPTQANHALDKMLSGFYGVNDWKEVTEDGDPEEIEEKKGELKNKVSKDLAKSTGLSYWATNQALADWADSSNDSNPDSLALQKSASEVFGNPLSKFQEDSIDEMLAGFGNGQADWEMEVSQNLGDPDIIVKSIYANTQEELRGMGIGPDDEVLLFRGISLPEGMVPGVQDYVGNALESWTTDQYTATLFGNTILATYVPAKDIFSLPTTGPGCIDEAEVIIFGSIPGMTVDAANIGVAGGELPYGGG